MAKYESIIRRTVEAVKWDGTIESILEIQSLTSSTRMELSFGADDKNEVKLLLVIILPNDFRIGLVQGEYVVKDGTKIVRWESEAFKSSWNEVQDEEDNGCLS